ncbi:MAG: protein-L-isoaspartate O-methyltransferase [Rhizobiaceae bacterium]|nr:protein-L-isoaspartate O-methyltransferase [Rhizobiaceae bacterium]
MTSEYAERRLKMVDGQLRTTDVNDAALLEAIFAVPREEFVPRAKRELAYIDEDLELAASGPEPRYLMEPSPFAKLVKLAAPRVGEVVLDVGCASGYSAAVLSRMASSVVALESDPVLAQTATETLSRLGFDNVAVVTGALQAGWAPEAPYDVIVVGGAVDDVPQALLDQLRVGGRLVAVVGEGNAGFACLYLKDEAGVSARRVANAAVKPLPGFRRAPSFAF